MRRSRRCGLSAIGLVASTDNDGRFDGTIAAQSLRRKTPSFSV